MVLLDIKPYVVGRTDGSKAATVLDSVGMVLIDSNGNDDKSTVNTTHKRFHGQRRSWDNGRHNNTTMNG